MELGSLRNRVFRVERPYFPEEKQGGSRSIRSGKQLRKWQYATAIGILDSTRLRETAEVSLHGLFHEKTDEPQKRPG